MCVAIRLLIHLDAFQYFSSVFLAFLSKCSYK